MLMTAAKLGPGVHMDILYRAYLGQMRSNIARFPPYSVARRQKDIQTTLGPYVMLLWSNRRMNVS